MGTVILLSCVGAWFLLRLRGGIFLHPRASLRTYVDGTRASGGHPLRTLMLALAGTLGVGNITGVVLAVRTGGAGTVFWLVLSSVFGATLKYAESVITLTSRGNPHYLGIPRLLSERRLTAPLAPAYAVLTLALAVFMGWMLQSSAVAGAARPLGVSPAVAVAVLLILLVPAALCGVSRIERITEFVIPAVAGLYAFLTLAVIVKYASGLPELLRTVLSDAFTKEGHIGNLLAVESGFSAGLLSNEAGAGTSALAHGRTENSPAAEGILGALEAMTDTAFLCPLTAFAVLLSGTDLSGDAVLAVGNSLSTVFGSLAYPLLGTCVFVFAFATAVCWFAYAQITAEMLTPRPVFSRAVMCAGMVSVALGACVPETVLARTSGVLLSALTFLTLPALLGAEKRLVSVSREYETSKKRKK